MKRIFFLLLICIAALSFCNYELEAKPAKEYHIDDILLSARNLTKEGQYEKAFELYLAAAKRGNTTAQFKTGMAYYSGKGVKKNNRQAMEWFRRAAKKQHAGSQFALGYLYEKGEGVPQKIYEAVKWYRKAALQDLKEAQYALGVCYAEGRGVKKNLLEAEHLFRLSSEQGYPPASDYLKKLQPKE